MDDQKKTEKVIAWLQGILGDWEPESGVWYLLYEDKEERNEEWHDNGDWCEKCANKQAEKYNAAVAKGEMKPPCDDFSRFYAVEETSPENDAYKRCLECGVLLHCGISWYFEKQELEYWLESCSIEWYKRLPQDKEESYLLCDYLQQMKEDTSHPEKYKELVEMIYKASEQQQGVE